LPFGHYGRDLLAHFYNSNRSRHGGNLEAVYNCKFGQDGGQFVKGMCVQDLERGVQDGISPDPWQTDTCVGDWYYKSGIKYKTTTTVVQMLADIVSKNGNLLLNFPVRADGTLDSEEEKILEGLSVWTSANGEAIYGTRPWTVYGEGVKGPAGGMFNEDKLQYTAEDIRFTTKGKYLYVIVLAWPTSGQLVIRSLVGHTPHQIRLVQGGDLLKWEHGPDGLAVKLPAEQRGDHAFVLRVEGVS
jgi:alpha-L-fucosidase